MKPPVARKLAVRHTKLVIKQTKNLILHTLTGSRKGKFQFRIFMIRSQAVGIFRVEMLCICGPAHEILVLTAYTQRKINTHADISARLEV